MKVHYVVARTPGCVTLETTMLDPANLKPDEVLLQTAYSAVSAGTERAWITGQSNNKDQRFPFYPGYSASGTVLAKGSAVTNLEEGDRVLIIHGGHRSHVIKKAETVFKIPDDSIDLLDAAFSFIGIFPMLGVRRLRLELGESVMIAGLGLLGLLAVQYARLSGAVPVLAADFNPARRALAQQLGADRVFDPGDADYIDQVRAAVGGKGVNAVVEVTGVAAALQQALRYVAREGRVSLLGCTRVPDAPIDFYRDVHLPGVTIIGAHSFARPKYESRPGQWTEFDDFRTFLQFVATGRVKVRPLISEVASPEKAPEIYGHIINEKQPPLGFVFDWNSLPQ